MDLSSFRSDFPLAALPFYRIDISNVCFSKIASTGANASGWVSFTYNGYGQRTDAPRGVTVNGASTTLSWTKFGYDARGRLSSRGQTFQNRAVTKTLNYGYDSVGKLLRVALPNIAVGCGYDADNRLMTLTHQDGKTMT